MVVVGEGRHQLRDPHSEQPARCHRVVQHDQCAVPEVSERQDLLGLDPDSRQGALERAMQALAHEHLLPVAVGEQPEAFDVDHQDRMGSPRLGHEIRP